MDIGDIVEKTEGLFYGREKRAVLVGITTKKGETQFWFWTESSYRKKAFDCVYTSADVVAVDRAPEIYKTWVALGYDRKLMEHLSENEYTIIKSPRRQLDEASKSKLLKWI